MNIFLDANIIIDVLVEREEFVEDSAKVLELAEEGKVIAFIPPLSLANAFYVLQSIYKLDKVSITDSLKVMMKFIKVTDMTEANVHAALNSDFKDFEDALQNFSAENNADISVIITRNEKDFTTSSLLIQSPKEFLETNNFN
ncbi:MAG: DNA-binding protein [Flexibacter sp. CG_4_10_14_3_um_filter_32_15]|nr:MAG: DNA-binding protein [Flexibacter sp. CG_4_10_14_3_um_filter_32_15]